MDWTTEQRFVLALEEHYSKRKQSSVNERLFLLQMYTFVETRNGKCRKKTTLTSLDATGRQMIQGIFALWFVVHHQKTEQTQSGFTYESGNTKLHWKDNLSQLLQNQHFHLQNNSRLAYFYNSTPSFTVNSYSKFSFNTILSSTLLQ